MLVKDIGTPARKFCDVLPAEDYSVALGTQHRTVTSNGGSSVVTTKDVSYTQYTAASGWTWQDLQLSIPLTARFRGAPIITLNDPTLATIDAHGIATPLRAGASTLCTVSVPGLGQRTLTYGVSTYGGQVSNVLMAFGAGTLGRHLTDSMAALVAGKTPPTFGSPVPDAFGGTMVSASSALLDVFRLVAGSGDYAASTKNVAGILAGIDTSCIALRYFPHGPNMTLITPRHVVYAGHYDFPDNLPVSFIGASGTVYTRTRTARRNVAVSPLESIEIGLLDSALPADVTPCKLAPANWLGYVPSGAGGAQYPIFGHTQDHRLCIYVMRGNDTNGTGGASWTSTPATAGTFAGWGQAIRANDSGSGNFFYVNGALNYLGHTYSYGPSGYSEAFYKAQIDAAIAGDGYSTTAADWSAFTYFG